MAAGALHHCCGWSERRSGDSDRAGPEGKLSLPGCVAAMVLAFVNVWPAVAIYVGITIMWQIPDRRIERHLVRVGGEGEG
ncbi:MAG TPA: hypothetical protein VK726_22205 [Acetobacteraceae bacterium]|nr:hypothetical protein [Acetobacteraceae bacterium]